MHQQKEYRCILISFLCPINFSRKRWKWNIVWNNYIWIKKIETPVDLFDIDASPATFAARLYLRLALVLWIMSGKILSTIHIKYLKKIRENNSNLMKRISTHCEFVHLNVFELQWNVPCDYVADRLPLLDVGKF